MKSRLYFLIVSVWLLIQLTGCSGANSEEVKAFNEKQGKFSYELFWEDDYGLNIDTVEIRKEPLENPPLINMNISDEGIKKGVSESIDFSKKFTVDVIKESGWKATAWDSEDNRLEDIDDIMGLEVEAEDYLEITFFSKYTKGCSIALPYRLRLENLSEHKITALELFQTDRWVLICDSNNAKNIIHSKGTINQENTCAYLITELGAASYLGVDYGCRYGYEDNRVSDREILFDYYYLGYEYNNYTYFMKIKKDTEYAKGKFVEGSHKLWDFRIYPNQMWEVEKEKLSQYIGK